MRVVDGAAGEGGGQIFRTALGLSLITGEAVRVIRIRAGRPRPGLLRQHLTALHAAAAVSSAEVTGAVLGSTEVTFHPGPVRAGRYAFQVGSAGSATLVLQTILPALGRLHEPSVVAVDGGTHNMAAPPFEFLQRAYSPLVRLLGLRVDFLLDRHGFHPRGGGRIEARVDATTPAQGLVLVERGKLLDRRLTALVAGLPTHIGERELATARKALGWGRDVGEVRVLPEQQGPGNAVLVELEHERVCEVFTGFGKKGLPAERVATVAAEQARRYLRTQVPVGEWLADQLLVPMALGGGGVLRTWSLSSHCRTQLALIPQFLDATFRTTEHCEDDVTVEVRV